MPFDFSVSTSDRSRRAELGFALIALVLAAVIQFTTSRSGLARETVTRPEILTALTLRSLAQDGLQIDYPTPVLGQPWKLPEAFGLYHNTVALLARGTGVPAETAGRWTSLVLFYLGLPALYLAARRLGATRGTALLAVVFWLLSPFACHQATALTGTTTALTLATWWLWIFLHGLSAPALWTRASAAILGAFAALAGPLVFLPFALTGIIFCPREPRVANRSPIFWWDALSGLLPALIAATLWASHTDQLKSANPYATFLHASQLWSAAFGTFAQRFEWDFWLMLSGALFTLVLTPLAALLLPIFSGALSSDDKIILRRLAFAPLCTLLLLLPHYLSTPGEIAAPILFCCLLLAWLTGRIFNFQGAAAWLAALLVLVGQSQLQLPATPELRSPLPLARELAQAVSLATHPTDLIITSGQDWDLLFAYRVSQRTILIPAGRETDLAALAKAVGPPPDWSVGAVVLTGRYRGEPGYVAALRQMFKLTEKPLLQTSASDVYVPADQAEDAKNRVLASAHAVLLPPDSPPPAPAPVASPMIPAAALVETKTTLAPFSMMSPLPSRHAVPYDLTAHDIDGTLCFFAHAPTTLEFDLPNGGTQLAMDFFMPAGAYSGKGNSDGVDVVAYLRQPAGDITELYRRHLDPAQTFGDRDRQNVQLKFSAASGATLIIQSQPGPEKRANFDWVYFRHIGIK